MKKWKEAKALEENRDSVDSAVADSGRSGQEVPATVDNGSTTISLKGYTGVLSTPQSLEAYDKELSKGNTVLNGVNQILESIGEE